MVHYTFGMHCRTGLEKPTFIKLLTFFSSSHRKRIFLHLSPHSYPEGAILQVLESESIIHMFPRLTTNTSRGRYSFNLKRVLSRAVLELTSIKILGIKNYCSAWLHWLNKCFYLPFVQNLSFFVY